MVEETESSCELLEPEAVSADDDVVKGVAETVPSRWHLAFALVAGFALIALPLVMWVRPAVLSAGAEADAKGDVAVVAGPAASTGQALEEFAMEEPAKRDTVKLGDVWIDKCEKPGPGKTAPEQCDRQPWFEQALVRAIRENTACAPERSGTLSVVMRVDHPRRKLEVFAGKSGAIRGRAAEGVIACVKRSVPDPPWNTLDHEHTKYIIAVMVTYVGKE